RGLPGFEVHALAKADCDPASHDAFPVLYVSPLEGNRPIVGADLASEPVRRAAIDDAIRTGLPTASAPIVLIDDPPSELGLLAVSPVRVPGDSPMVHGLVAAAIRFQSLLVNALAYPDPVEPRTRVALLLLEPGKPPKLLAAFPATSGDASGPLASLTQEASVVRPIFFLGQTFSVVVVPGKSSGVGLSALVVGFLGLLLTVSVTGLVTSLAGRRARLDREVRERTVTLRESEGTLRAIVDSALNAIVMIDARGCVTLWNRAAERMFGHSTSEAAGRDLHQLIAPQWMRPEAEEGLRRFQTAGDGPAIGRVTELLALRKDETQIPVELALAPVHIEGTWHAVGVMSDLSERHRIEAERRTMEQHVVEAQKIESLGVLAGGVAHDFNNILMSMVARTDAAMLKLPAGSPARTSLQDVKQQARRAADLVRQMLAFSGKGRYLVEPLDLAALVDDVIPLVRTSLPRVADLRVEMSPDLPRLQGDATQIRQLVTNLLLNAGEALDGGRGTVTVTAGHGWFTAEELAVPHLLLQPKTGPYVWIEVVDTGSGMDAATLRRIFEPFFSTKTLGRGLGMSAVLGIVRGHRGSLQLHSHSGEGTTCRVFLPTVAAD
ncbi:MAG TPA: CHASE domain-containing protein, partial [Thermoanaerobaculaceae bacterium]|nr:CHASE domain-containing protein [Thermoanaerobaculaceae bacterium]